MVPAAEGGVLWPHYHCCDCRVEGCKRHRPYGCREYYESMGYTNVRCVTAHRHKVMGKLLALFLCAQYCT